MSSRPKLLILELWGLGDLAIASHFLEKASEKYDVTLLAKPYAHDLQQKLWPQVKVVDFIAPWTAFKGKYQLHRWPWRRVLATLRQLRKEKFDIAASGRWDPRDHAWMRLTGARKRIGFPRSGSNLLLTRSLTIPGDLCHRYDQWRTLGKALDLDIPDWKQNDSTKAEQSPIEHVVIHTGAAQPVRVWSLEGYASLLEQLEKRRMEVSLICDASQTSFWEEKGQKPSVPSTVSELIQRLSEGEAFIGNDSGPGHLAAALKKPTFTIFGPQRTEWFRPAHPQGMVVEGKDCPHKPCFDSCQFDTPHCMTGVTQKEVMEHLEKFLEQFP
jgi:ADP-heptose:LPS heptosyltransferase